MYYKIYPFQAYNSVRSCKVVQLLPQSSLRAASSCQKDPSCLCTLSHPTPIPGNTHLLPASKHLPFLSLSQWCNHDMWSLCLTPFTEHNFFLKFTQSVLMSINISFIFFLITAKQYSIDWLSHILSTHSPANIFWVQHSCSGQSYYLFYATILEVSCL